MNQTKKEFLTLVTLPARLGISETAWLLGFSEHDIPGLVSAGLLKPLGRPSATGFKFFATVELQDLRNDTRWLARASDAIVNHWRSKNAGRRDKADAVPRSPRDTDRQRPGSGPPSNPAGFSASACASARPPSQPASRSGGACGRSPARGCDPAACGPVPRR